MITSTFKVYAHQNKFIRTKSKFPALVGGFGSGKTVAFCLKALLEGGRNSGYQILLAEPTYGMIKDVLQPTFEWVLKELKFNYTYVAGDLRYKVQWSGGRCDFLLRSAETYQRWAGLNLAQFGLDEAASLKTDNAWKMGLSRIRKGNHLGGFTTTTPEGFNWHYEYWEDDPKKGYQIIRAKTMDNKHLPQEFIDSLLDNYDERLVRAYLHGEYVNLQYGRTYYSFTREGNERSGLEFDKTKVLRIGMDFNVDPTCAVIWQMYNNSPKIRILDEVKLRHSGEDDLMTERVCREIKRRFPNAIQYICYPDPAGKSRGTSTKQSDFDIIRNEGFRIKAKRQAPSLTDSVNAVNNAMRTLVVDKRCKALIRDWEQVVNKEGTRDIDKSNKELTHMSDGIRYALDLEFPVRKMKIRQL